MIKLMNNMEALFLYNEESNNFFNCFLCLVLCIEEYDLTIKFLITALSEMYRYYKIEDSMLNLK